MIPQSQLSRAGAPSGKLAPAKQRRMKQLILLAGALLAGWMLLFSPWESFELRLAAAALVLGGLWPMARWIGSDDHRYPLMETLLAMTLPFYAVPLIMEHRLVTQYPEEVLQVAVACVVIFQLSAILGARLPSRRQMVLQSPAWTEPVLPDHRLHLIGYGMLLNTGWLMVSAFTTWVPPELTGTFRALFFGIGLISSFTLARLWARGELAPGEKALLVANLVLQLALITISLLLIQAITLLGVVLLGYFSQARRVPWFPILASLVVFTVLHNGKSEMRQRYWTEGRPAVTLTGLPAFFTEWFDAGLKNLQQDEQAHSLLLLDRASLLQTTAYVVDNVPARLNYLGGESYGLIPLQLIPRFLWPDKPSPNRSVILLSVGLGILTEEQAAHTSIGFGMVAEAYANFGLLGAALLGLVLGSSLQWVAYVTAGAPDFSMHGLVRILCLAWCLNAEATAALWFSSLYQAIIAVCVPLAIWRILTR